MREIKFRAWDLKEKEMYSWDFIVNNQNEKGFRDFLMNNKYIKIQFTGLKDKNRKEIYEGDIVKFKFQGQEGKGIIIWHDKSASFRVHYDKYNIIGLEFDLYFIEVIGNKFENPELLKKFQGEEE